MKLVDILLILAIAAPSLGYLSMIYIYLKQTKKIKLEEEARTNASAILNKANQEALAMLDSSKVVSAKDQAILENAVKQIVQDQSLYLKSSIDKLMQEFISQLSQAKTEDLKAFSSTSESLKSAASGQLEEYKLLLGQIKASTDSFQQEFKNELTQIKNNNLASINEVSKDFKSTATAQLNEYAQAFSQVKSGVDKLLQDFQAQMLQIKNYDINTLTNVSKDIEKDTSAKINEYTKVLEEETINSQKSVNKKIEDEYKLVESEIAKYKDEQYKKIEVSLENIVKQLTADILQKSITPQDHKNLIIEALEKAKNDNILVG